MSGEEPSFTSAGLFDLHSHLVPDVDDGAQTFEDTREGLERMVAAGVADIITTPHVNASMLHDPDLFERWAARIEEQWPAVEAAAEGLAVTVARGHEVMLDVPDASLADPRLTLGDTPCILVEWPRLQVPPASVAALQRVVAQGLRPIIAHPERYNGLDREMRIIGEWKRAGAVLQTNYGSLVGRYGPRPRARAIRLLERGWIDMMSTDFHGRPHLKLYINEARAFFEDLDAGESWSLLSGINARRILSGETVLPVPMLEVPRGLWTRVKGFFEGP